MLPRWAARDSTGVLPATSPIRLHPFDAWKGRRRRGTKKTTSGTGVAGVRKTARSTNGHSSARAARTRPGIWDEKYRDAKLSGGKRAHHSVPPSQRRASTSSQSVSVMARRELRDNRAGAGSRKGPETPWRRPHATTNGSSKMPWTGYAFTPGCACSGKYALRYIGNAPRQLLRRSSHAARFLTSVVRMPLPRSSAA